MGFQKGECLGIDRLSVVLVQLVEVEYLLVSLSESSLVD